MPCYSYAFDNYHVNSHTLENQILIGYALKNKQLEVTQQGLEEITRLAIKAVNE